MIHGAWRSWAEAASPDLMRLFNAGSREVIVEVRHRYAGDCSPGDPQYKIMKQQCTEALDNFAETIQEEYDDAID